MTDKKNLVKLTGMRATKVFNSATVVKTRRWRVFSVVAIVRRGCCEGTDKTPAELAGNFVSQRIEQLEEMGWNIFSVQFIHRTDASDAVHMEFLLTAKLGTKSVKTRVE